MLTVQHLEKTFVTDKGSVRAVDGVGFNVPSGEFYTLLGPSGCGKTTTLQCIAGLEMPDEGEIILGDKLVFSKTKNILVPAHRRDIGMVFQSYAIWPHMTVFENVAFPLLHGRRRVSRSAVQDRVMKALHLVQLTGLETRPAPFLSGGQQQRVALARAIVDEPKVLLLDEPLSNLDAKLREEMRFELRDLVLRLHITTLYVTHDQIEALSMSDRIAVMSNGTIIQEGTPREIYLTPRDRFVADFLGKSNFLEGRVLEVIPSTGRGKVDTGVGPLHCLITLEVQPGDAVLLGFRPAAFLVAKDGCAGNINTFRGQISSISFAGDFLECQVRVQDQQLRILLDPYQEFKMGDVISLHIPQDRLATVARL
jgi:iron(III) transport system ATP-binding protein